MSKITPFLPGKVDRGTGYVLSRRQAQRSVPPGPLGLACAARSLGIGTVLAH